VADSRGGQDGGRYTVETDSLGVYMHVSRITAAVAALAAVAVGTLIAPASAGVGTTGNGAPSGSHYTLNVIGMDKGKTADMTGNNGRRIFVGLGANGAPARTKILLSEGEFNVLDANGTDGQAGFQLPNPDENADGKTEYSVFVRALGKPGGKATMQSCYDDPASGETWCAVDYDGGVEPVTVERTQRGVAKFVNVSQDLLYVDACEAYDTTTLECTRWDQLPLFSDANGNNTDDEQYFWDYNNEGLRVAQLRFYDVETVTDWYEPTP
jgi:hypothetical protein